MIHPDPNVGRPMHFEIKPGPSDSGRKAGGRHPGEHARRWQHRDRHERDVRREGLGRVTGWNDEPAVVARRIPGGSRRRATMSFVKL
jgi:hypothetical protein